MNKIRKSFNIVKQLMFILNRQQKMYGAIILVLTFVGSFLEVIGVSAIIPLLNAIIEIDEFKKNQYIQKLVCTLDLRSDIQILFVIGVSVIIFYILKNVYFICLSWCRAKYSTKIQREFAVGLMKTYMKKGYLFFVNSNAAKLQHDIIADSNSISVTVNSILKIVIDLLTILMIGLFIFTVNWKVAVALLIFLGIGSFFIFLFFRKMLNKSGEIFRTYGAEASKHSIQAFQGIKEIIVSGRQQYFVDGFERAYTLQLKGSVMQTIGTESPAYVIEMVCVIGLLMCVCVMSVTRGMDKNSLLSTLAVLGVGAFRIMPSLGRVSASLNQLLFYSKPLKVACENLKASRENNSVDAANKCDVHSIEFHKDLKLKNVSWHYGKRTKNVLENLSLTIHKGEAVGIIGRSGAGKSTLIDIILGLLQPQAGEVLVDEKSIFELGNSWSRMIGFVPQTIYMIDGTVRENIAFGIEKNVIDDDKIWDALAQAQLKKFIEDLPRGLDTFVGDRGIKFSGGQRQRIAIARALYSNPDILILDEATAALDGETEEAIMEAIDALQGKKTLIIIAHRLTTVKNCDSIYDIVNGKAILKEYSELIEE